MEDLNSESDLDMTEVWPPVPPATRVAPATEPRVGAGEGRKAANPLTSSISPGRVDFSGIHGSKSRSSSDDSYTSRESSKINDIGDLSALAWRPVRDLEGFGELPALQSERMRSQSQGLYTSTFCVDALLAFAIRTVETKTTVEKAAEIE